MNRLILVSVLLSTVACSDDDVGGDAEVDMSIADMQGGDTNVLDAVLVDVRDDANVADGDVEDMMVSDAQVDMNLPDAPLVCSSGLTATSTYGPISADVCCAASCGECGGDGCETRPGGQAACCSIDVLTSGRSCQDQEPPCVLLEDAPVDPCLTAGGLPGGRICCASSCGTCGGEACNTRPGGAANCCGGDIRSSGNVCGTPPCFYE